MSKVYFIQEGDKGPIKIGCSKAVEKRLSAMKSDNLRKLTLLCAIGGGDNEVEWLRREFKELHLRGNWYTAGDRLVKAIDAINSGSPVKFKSLVDSKRLKSYKRERDRSENIDLTH